MSEAANTITIVSVVNAMCCCNGWAAQIVRYSIIAGVETGGGRREMIINYNNEVKL